MLIKNINFSIKHWKFNFLDLLPLVLNIHIYNLGFGFWIHFYLISHEIPQKSLIQAIILYEMI